MELPSSIWILVIILLFFFCSTLGRALVPLSSLPPSGSLVDRRRIVATTIAAGSNGVEVTRRAKSSTSTGSQHVQSVPCPRAVNTRLWSRTARPELIATWEGHFGCSSSSLVSCIIKRIFFQIAARGSAPRIKCRGRAKRLSDISHLLGERPGLRKNQGGVYSVVGNQLNSY